MPENGGVGMTYLELVTCTKHSRERSAGTCQYKTLTNTTVKGMSRISINRGGLLLALEQSRRKEIIMRMGKSDVYCIVADSAGDIYIKYTEEYHI